MEHMDMLGYILLIVGVPSLMYGLQRTRSNKSVKANHSSVAVGGDNLAPISITTTARTDKSTNSAFWCTWSVISGLASLSGLVLTLWPKK